MKCMLCEQSRRVLSMKKRSYAGTEQFRPKLQSDENVFSVLISIINVLIETT